MNYYDVISKALKIIRSCETFEQTAGARRMLVNLKEKYLHNISIFNSKYVNVWNDLISLEKELVRKNKDIKSIKDRKQQEYLDQKVLERGFKAITDFNGTN